MAGGLADVGYLLFLDLPGYVSFVPGTVVTMVSATAIVLSGWLRLQQRRAGEDALAASWPHDRPLVVAFTSDGELLRRYDENGCGHPDCVVGLVQQEVADIATPWVFGACLPRPQPYLEMVHDADGDEVGEVLRPPSSSAWTAMWYAEARGGGVADTLAGYLDLNGEDVTAAGPLDVTATTSTRGFHRMLYRHPARRLHRAGGRWSFRRGRRRGGCRPPRRRSARLPASARGGRGEWPGPP